MTVEDESKAEKTVLVGIRLDSHNREQINWALVKVAEPGDCVFAIHVCRNSDRALKDKPLLDTYLDVYEGLCKEKQVTLIGKISIGSSIRKVMVKEAKICAADTLVVGVNKPNALGSWTSVAKYCTKHLPAATKVIAVNNGKAISTNSAATREDSRPNVTKNVIPKCETDEKHDGSKVDDSIKHVNGSRKVNSRSISLFAGQPILDQSQRPGWPLLRNTALPPKRNEARKLSVVQWVMSLPDRSPPQTPQSSSDSDCSGFNVTTSDTNSTPSSDPNSPASKSELEILLKSCSFGFKWFSHEVLKIITSQFSSENLIGKGGSNQVYKGVLPDGKNVAVKILYSSEEGSWREFATEIDIITSLKHKHITNLIGICVEDNNLISVYDYLPKGSLDENLQHPTKNGGEVLSWQVRFDIAVGVAEALCYLHDECSRPIIHRDVKSSNILLSDTLEPQLCDFGLAIWGPTTSSCLTKVDIVGTFGYLAPEYFMYGKVSDKIDVYSYGVVLLELLSGKKPICSETGQESLVMWAKPKIESGDLKGLLDPNLDGKNIDEIQVKRVVLAAALCLTRSARLRPKMSEILKLLKGDKDIERGIKFETENDSEEKDDEVYPESCAESHLSLALLDVEEDLTSFSSSMELDQSNISTSIEDYLRGRWSRSVSLD